MIKNLWLLIFMIIINFPLSAAPSANRGWGKNQNEIKISYEQRERIMELKAELIQREKSINYEIRELREEMNRCMMAERVDRKKYQLLKKEDVKLRNEKMRIRQEYMLRIERIKK